MTIYFYITRDAYGGFSNFSRHGFTLKGLWWPTSEHYFQAQKFAGSEHEEAVRRAKTPKAIAHKLSYSPLCHVPYCALCHFG